MSEKQLFETTAQKSCGIVAVPTILKTAITIVSLYRCLYTKYIRITYDITYKGSLYLDQKLTLQFLRCSSFSNIFIISPILLLMVYQFPQKCQL